jgi:hypothetical protein
MKCLYLETWAVTRDEEPMADLISQELDGTDGGKFPAKLRISWVRALRENKPDAVVPRRLEMISQHANDAVVQVDGKTRKHETHLGVQGPERFHNERVRSLPFWFGRTRHGLSERTITDGPPLSANRH